MVIFLALQLHSNLLLLLWHEVVILYIKDETYDTEYV